MRIVENTPSQIDMRDMAVGDVGKVCSFAKTGGSAGNMDKKIWCVEDCNKARMWIDLHTNREVSFNVENYKVNLLNAELIIEGCKK